MESIRLTFEYNILGNPSIYTSIPIVLSYIVQLPLPLVNRNKFSSRTNHSSLLSWKKVYYY